MHQRLSQDYALRLVAYLAEHPGPVSSKKLAQEVGMSRSYLIQLCGRLRDAGIVGSKAGIGGGYWLSRSPGGIKVCEIADCVTRAAETGPSKPCALCELLDSQVDAVRSQPLSALLEELGKQGVAEPWRQRIGAPPSESGRFRIPPA